MNPSYEALDFEALARQKAELERNVQERTEELQEANHELESFTYSVSHDLRAPLRSILGFANILAEDYGDVLGAEGLGMVQRQIDAARRMDKLISDLLEYSRVGRREIVRSEFDLSRLALDVSSEICERTQGCEAKFDIQPGLRVNADPSLLRFVLQNFFENSIKYSTPNGHAEIQFGQTPEGAFFVRDQGVGFDMKYAGKLFQPFERLHSSSEFPGTGIGLANVYRIIQRHRGKVWAIGEPGKGATFFFSLG